MPGRLTMMALALYIYLVFACSSLVEGFTASKSSSLQGRLPSPSLSTRRRRPQSWATQTDFTEESLWDEQFAALQRYKNEFGDCLVPLSYSVDDPQLKHWVQMQRKAAKEGKITDDRMKRLESIGFIFDPLDYIWGFRFADLQRYKNEYGDCLVPQSYSDDPQLGSWVQMQRDCAKYDKMSDDQMKLLESIGFAFDVSDDLWGEKFAALQRYKNEYDNCLVPQKYSDDPKLARWVRKQRQGAKAGKLTDDRIKRLESIGFVFDVPATPRVKATKRKDRRKK